MRLRHLGIKNFRSIKKLDWPLLGDFICLIGPGDSGKSSILDAIDFVLSPRWNLPFDDSDFHGASTESPIIIEATIGDLPRRLMSDAQFGLRLRGLSSEGVLHDEPEEDDEPVLTIRLTVDRTLEPVWEVVTDRHPEGAPIHARERERLAAVRLGAVVDRQLSWSRGTVLARLTGETQEHAELLADAGRRARGALGAAQVPKLDEAAKQAASLSKAFGVLAQHGFRPGLDASASLGAGALSLHDGPIPVRQAGLGTRRLVTLAVQRDLASDGGVVLIDEIEHGLEPYRLRRLLAELLQPTATKEKDGTTPAVAAGPRSGLVALTTHSPVALAELRVEHLRVVRREADETRVLAPTASVQGALRTHAEAFLSRKVIVCEGKTELGFVRGLDEAWASQAGPFALNGVALAYGGGRTNVGKTSMVFANLGYGTAVFADSDEDLDITPVALVAGGVTVIQWSDRMAIEQRILSDLPWDGVADVVELAMREHGLDRVRAQVANDLKVSTKDLSERPAEWNAVRTEADIRAVLGTTANKCAWFKIVDRAQALAQIVVMYLPQVAQTDLATKVFALEKWVRDA